MLLTGNLTATDAANAEAKLDSRDIILRLDDGECTIRDSVELCDGFIGLRKRGDGSVNINKLKISRIKNDGISAWSGGISINELEINHTLPFVYSKKNHADCAQFYGKSNVDPFPSQEFRDLYIGYANCVVKSHGVDDKKNGFIFSEPSVYRNISLFPLGIDYQSDSPAPYFVDMANATNCTIGSESNPIDPDRVSGKGIRVGSPKKGNPESHNITIHTYEGLQVVTRNGAKDAVTIIEYKKPSEAIMNTMKMSVSGTQTLMKSEKLCHDVYIDQAGLATIGVGHCLTQSEIFSGKIELGDGSILDIRTGPISTAQAQALLQSDLVPREAAVNNLFTVPLKQHQFDALVHWLFNVGEGAARTSTLRRKLNNGEFDSVPAQLERWNIVTVNGQKIVSEGLVNRRIVEIAMWNGEYLEGAQLPEVIKPDYDPMPSQNYDVSAVEKIIAEMEGRLEHKFNQVESSVLNSTEELGQEALKRQIQSETSQAQLKIEAISQYKQENTQTQWQSRTNRNLVGVWVSAAAMIAVNVFELPSFVASPEAVSTIASVINVAAPIAISVFAGFAKKYRNAATKFIK